QETIAAAVGNHEAARKLAQDKLRQSQRDYRQALAAGELERAREAARRHAALLSEQVLGQQLLAVDVLATLEPEQRAQLLEGHPNLLAGMAQERPRRQRGERGARLGPKLRGD